MALIINSDINTGIELDNMYFRIDKINLNDTHFQVVATGYASEDAFRNGKRPISEPRQYTLENYNKKDIGLVFQYAYEVLKQHPVFKDSLDSMTEEQRAKRKGKILKENEVVQDVNGMAMTGAVIPRNLKGLY